MTEEQAPAEAASSNEDQPERHFAIHKIYVKDISLECPNSPDVFIGEWKPKVDFNLNSVATELTDSNHEVVLKATVTVESAGKVAYLVEVQQAGIFHLSGYTEVEAEQWNATYCANILFPYLREAVSDFVTRAGFPQLLLSPINFEAAYAEQKAEAAGQAAAQES